MTQGPRFRIRGAVWATALFAIVFVVDILCPISTSEDSRWTIPVAISLLDRGSTNIDEYITATRYPGNSRFPGLYVDYSTECVKADGTVVREEICSDGHYYSWYPVAVPAMASPVVFGLRKAVQTLSPLLRKFADADGTPVWSAFLAGDFIRSRNFVEVVVASFFVALTTVLIFFIGRLFLPCTHSALLALVFAFATPAWSSASRALWQHGPSMLMLSLSLYLLLLGNEKAFLIPFTAIPVALAYVVRPTNSLWVAMVTLYVAVHYRRYLLRYLLCALPIAAAFAIYNESIYHRVLPSYFLLQPARPTPRDAIRILQALAGTLASPSRGLLIYTPVFCFSLWGMVWAARTGWRAPLTRYLMAAVACNWMLIAFYFQFWWGGHSYGPRVLGDLSPFFAFFLIPALLRWQTSAKWPPRTLHVVFALLLCASVFVHGRGVQSVDVYLWNPLPEDVNIRPARVWDWSDPQFLRGLSREPSATLITPDMHRTEAAPPYHVDQIETRDMTTELRTGIFRSDLFVVSGWAADPLDGPAARVDVVVDGRPYGARYGLERPDIATAFKKPSYERSGFRFSAPAGQLPRGPHLVSVRIIDRDNKTYFESSPVSAVPPPGDGITAGRGDPVEGSLDVVDNARIAGWAWDMAYPDRPVRVEIYDGSTWLATVPAGVFRQDLLDARKGNGAHAFTYPNPIGLEEKRVHTIRVVVAGTNIEVAGSPKTFNASR